MRAILGDSMNHNLNANQSSLLMHSETWFCFNRGCKITHCQIGSHMHFLRLKWQKWNEYGILECIYAESRFWIDLNQSFSYESNPTKPILQESSRQGREPYLCS